MIRFYRDLYNFIQQIIPSPIAAIYRYKFSPDDLGRVATKQLLDAHAHSIISAFDVLSYNINYAASSSPTRSQLILTAIFSSGASIILLQETNPAWEKLLQHSAGARCFHHCYFHHPREGNLTHPPDRPAGGITVLSQYPLENIRVLDFTDEISGSVFPSLLFTVFVPVTLNSIDGHVCVNVANVHLRPPVDLDGKAWLDTERKTEPIRLAEVKGLMRWIARTETSTHDSINQLRNLDIIAGDFNEGDVGASLSYLSNVGFTDALNQFVPWWKETHMWPFMNNLVTLRKRLDHILWRSDLLPARAGEHKPLFKLRLKCQGCGIMTGYENGASDHQPVLSRFAIVQEIEDLN